jgi:hypothetical protein
MAAVVETQVDSVRTMLVNLLERLRHEKRAMTPLERQRFSVGVRVLAHYKGCTPSQVMESLTSPHGPDDY